MLVVRIFISILGKLKHSKSAIPPLCFVPTNANFDFLISVVKCHPKVQSYIKWAKFEETQGDIQRAREVYEAALEHLEEEAYDSNLFAAFAAFEERSKEYERARGIYKYALDHLPKHLAREVYKTFIQFEKKFGTKEGIEDVILNKRRFQYEEV